MRRTRRVKQAVALAATFGLLFESAGMHVVAAGRQQAATAAAKPASGSGQTPPATSAPGAVAAKPAAAPEPTPLDGGWPRMYSLPSGGSILVYQPQISSWANQKQMVAYSAVSYRLPAQGTQKPALGTVRLETNTSVAVADRLVPPDQVRDLWLHWQRPELVWYQGGHLSFRLHAPVRHLVKGALEKAGLLA